MKIETLLTQMLWEHQRREIELRRMQNRVALETACGYVAILWTSPDDSRIESVVIPVSQSAPANWHVEGKCPFVLEAEDDPHLEPMENDIDRPWVQWWGTEGGVECMVLGESSMVVAWKDVEYCTNTHHFMFCAFRSDQGARSWMEITKKEYEENS